MAWLCTLDVCISMHCLTQRLSPFELFVSNQFPNRISRRISPIPINLHSIFCNPKTGEIPINHLLPFEKCNVKMELRPIYLTNHQYIYRRHTFAMALTRHDPKRESHNDKWKKSKREKKRKIEMKWSLANFIVYFYSHFFMIHLKCQNTRRVSNNSTSTILDAKKPAVWAGNVFKVSLILFYFWFILKWYVEAKTFFLFGCGCRHRRCCFGWA